MTKISIKAKKILKAGFPKGKVKCKRYLNYLVNVRSAENDLRAHGFKVMYRSIAEIRKEFEEQYGSIYIEM